MEKRTTAKALYAAGGAAVMGTTLVIVALAALLLLPAEQTLASGPEGQATDTAHLMVQFSDGRTYIRPVTFTGVISHLGALDGTDLNVRIEVDPDYGPGLCAVEGIGCPTGDCFCSDNQWTTSLWDGSQWTQPWPAPDLQDGDVWGYAYDAGWPPEVASPHQFVAASNALEYLRARQSITDGGYGTPGNSAEVMLGVSANGYDPAQWHTGPISRNLVNYFMTETVTSYAATSAAANGKLLLALSGAGQVVTNFRGINLVTSLTQYYDDATGAYGSGFLDQQFAMLGMAASQTVPSKAVQYLKDAQQDSGGWEASAGWGTDTNSTGLAMQALIAAGEPVTSPAIISGFSYLRTAQNDDGGFTYDPNSAWGTDSDTNSTAYVIQGLIAAGQPLPCAWATINGDPVGFLLDLQLSDGSLEWKKGVGPNQMATQQAVTTLLNRQFPLNVTTSPGTCRVIYAPTILKDSSP